MHLLENALCDFLQPVQLVRHLLGIGNTVIDGPDLCDIGIPFRNHRRCRCLPVCILRGAAEPSAFLRLLFRLCSGSLGLCLRVLRSHLSGCLLPGFPGSRILCLLPEPVHAILFLPHFPGILRIHIFLVHAIRKYQCGAASVKHGVGKNIVCAKRLNVLPDLILRNTRFIGELRNGDVFTVISDNIAVEIEPLHQRLLFPAAPDQCIEAIGDRPHDQKRYRLRTKAPEICRKQISHAVQQQRHRTQCRRKSQENSYRNPSRSKIPGRKPAKEVVLLFCRLPLRPCCLLLLGIGTGICTSCNRCLCLLAQLVCHLVDPLPNRAAQSGIIACLNRL